MHDSKPARRITLADVAARAGVSRATASRALAQDPRITEATRTLVESAAAELEYVPNVAARSLRARRSRTLGLLLSDLSDPVHAQVASGFELEAAKSDYTVVIVSAGTSADGDAERSALKVFMERSMDGICIASSTLDPVEAQQRAGASHLVIVQPDHVRLLSKPRELPPGTIRTDDASGVQQSVRHLLSRGYRDIAFLGSGVKASNRLRESSADRTLRESVGRSVRAFNVSDDAWRTPEIVVAELGPVLPEAVICYDDKLALALLDGLRSRGIDVPGDVAVVGFDDMPFAALSNPRLTTVATPTVEMGRLAARTLIGAIATGKMPPPRVLPVELVIRDSSTPTHLSDTGTVARASGEHE